MALRYRSAVLLVAVVLSGWGHAQPDVIVGDITGPANYSADATHDAFAMGTTSCNMGTTPLTWVANTNQHPVIGYSLYRIHNGRFMQVGQSWLKHGFFALQQTLCGPCNAHPNGSALGVGCSDPYGAGLNGQQGNLGPKYQVNASTGAFPYPPANPSWSGPTARRCRVPKSLLDAPGATWVSEAQYVQNEDAMANNDDNNASYRFSNVTGGPNDYALSYTGPTVREEAAIHAWAAIDPAVVLQTVQVPGPMGGMLIVASRRSANPNGTWHFEYAVHNLNCHDSVSAFTVNFNSTAITNQGFHAVESHSGELPNNNSWMPSSASNGVTWNTDQTFAQDPNANAIRWGTTYSFWFDSTESNPTGAVIGLFRSEGSVNVPAPGHQAPPWQVNQATSTLAVDGMTNSAFAGPIQGSFLSGTPHVLDIGGAAGAVYQIYVASVPGIPGLYTTPNEQTVNIDFNHSSYGPFGTPTTMPSGGLQLPFQASFTNVFVAAQMAVFDPAHAEGVALSALNEIQMGPRPAVLTSIAPQTASAGMTVTIDGQDFIPGCTIDVAGVTLTPTAFAETQLTFTMPPGMFCDAPVTVHNPNTTPSNDLTLNPSPAVAVTVGNTGPAAGGATLIIIGQYLADATVTIGGVPPASITTQAQGVISLVTPPGPVGVTSVVLTAPSGCSTTTPYTYQ